jgi:hypothetical protein
MDSKIYDLWEEVILFGYNIRKNTKDGKAGWDAIKVLIPDMGVSWLENSKTFYDKLVALEVNTSETSEEAGMSHEEWERNHFLIQHGRIINKNPDGSLVRLLQIAYNIGQFKRELELTKYTDDQMRFYIVNELNKVTSYIKVIDKLEDDVIAKLKDVFETNIKGGYKHNDMFFLKDYIMRLRFNNKN